MGNELTSTGTSVKVWKKVNSVKRAKILDSWKRTTLMLSRNKLLTKKTRKNFKKRFFLNLDLLLYCRGAEGTFSLHFLGMWFRSHSSLCSFFSCNILGGGRLVPRSCHHCRGFSVQLC